MPIIRFVPGTAKYTIYLATRRCNLTSGNPTTQLSDSERALLYTVRAGALAILFMPLIVTSQTLFPFIVGKALFARSVIEITAAVWLMLIFAYPKYKPTRSWVLTAFGAWVIISLLAGFTGVSLLRSLWSTYERMQGIVDLAHWFAFVVILSTTFRNFNDWKLVFSVNLGVSTLVSVLGIGAYIDIWESDLIGTGTRIQSTLGNATYVGAYTMVNVLIAIGLMPHAWQDNAASTSHGAARRRRRRSARRSESRSDARIWLSVFWISSIGINLCAFWLAGTRGSFVGMAAGTLAFASMYVLWGAADVLRKVVYAILGIAAVATIFVIVAMTTPWVDPIVDSSTTLRRITTVNLEDASLKGRTTAVGAGLRAYLDKPFFGWGPENYLIAWGRYFDMESGVVERFDQAHNKLAEELTTKGAFGLAAYVWIWAAMGWIIVIAMRRRDRADKIMVAFVGAALVGFFAQNMFLFDSPVTAFQFAMMVAFVAAEEQWQRRTNEASEPDRRSTGFLSFDSSLARNVGVLLRTPVGGIVGAITLAALVTAALVFFNIRAFTAATAVVQTTNPQISWDERFGYFEESIDDFPGLANYPRLLLLSQVTNNIGSLTTDELTSALGMIEREGIRAIEDEPESWRVHLSMARFYQLLSQANPDFLDAAREHLDEGIKLAPRTLEADSTRREQERLEAARP